MKINVFINLIEQNNVFFFIKLKLLGKILDCLELFNYIKNTLEFKELTLRINFRNPHVFFKKFVPFLNQLNIVWNQLSLTL
jgi:hypothetical protein